MSVLSVVVNNPLAHIASRFRRENTDTESVSAYKLCTSLSPNSIPHGIASQVLEIASEHADNGDIDRALVTLQLGSVLRKQAHTLDSHTTNVCGTRATALAPSCPELEFFREHLNLKTIHNTDTDEYAFQRKISEGVDKLLATGWR